MSGFTDRGADTNLCFRLKNPCVDTNKSTKLYTLLKDTVSMEMCPKNDKKSQIFLTLIRLHETLWLQYALSYYPTITITGVERDL